MNLQTQHYLEQNKQWPQEGRHILAQYDDSSIVVYQAYRKSIGIFAAKNQFFGGDFSYTRTSWIKTNFLWMMYRSGWGTKAGQEIILAIRISRELFEKILELAISSTYNRLAFPTEKEWSIAGKKSPVRLQWDPDHSPTGAKVERKAIQLGLRREILDKYGKEPLEIEDISDFVAEQRENAKPSRYEQLVLPLEHVYTPQSEIARQQVYISEKHSHSNNISTFSTQNTNP